ncbi:MAG: 3-dehydroquinate synthase [Clostridia bacterium]|nr:3-dehydroquinate synthase [Clostridia bacterium]
MSGKETVLNMPLGDRSYDIRIGRGILRSAGKYMDLQRKVLILTDKGVPREYAQTIEDQCREAYVIRLPRGEQNKSPETYIDILKKMCSAGFDRKDCVVAVGGGVIGDLAGFAAATYMRGVDFYNIPTTLLSQIDSSVGGKTAIDLGGYKNIVGAFHQPKAVLIDPDVLISLDSRQFSCGMAEAIKMFATSGKEVFESLENRANGMTVETIIRSALEIKISIVSQDEKESGLRKLLNFGHTVGHAVEAISSEDFDPLLHGECVSIGMLCMCEGETRNRLMHLLHRYDLPTAFRCRADEFRAALTHDKKITSGLITVVRLNDIGDPYMEKQDADQIINSVGEVVSLL